MGRSSSRAGRRLIASRVSATRRRRERSVLSAARTTPVTGDRRLIDHEDVLAEDLAHPVFRREWERTARGHRAEHDLSQLQLAERLGVHQSEIAEMESGELAGLKADRIIETWMPSLSPGSGRRKGWRRPLAAKGCRSKSAAKRRRNWLPRRCDLALHRLSTGRSAGSNFRRPGVR